MKHRRLETGVSGYSHFHIELQWHSFHVDGRSRQSIGYVILQWCWLIRILDQNRNPDHC